MNGSRWSELQPVINYANRLVCDPGFEFGPRTIADFQFIYVVKGKGSAEIQGRPFSANKGDLFYYGPNIVHRFKADDKEPFTLIGIHFRWYDKIENYTRALQIIEPFLSASPNQSENTWFIEEDGEEKLIIMDIQHLDDAEASHILLQMISCFKTGTFAAATVNRALLIYLLYLLKEQINKNEPQPRKMLLEIKAKLQTNRMLAYSRKWLTEWSGYQEDYIARQFKNEFGISPHQYHIEQKLEKAKEKLEQERNPISSLAVELHFGSVHYFCRAFKAYTGFSPKQYRQWKQRI